MILAVAVFMLLGFLTLAIVGVKEAQLGVDGFVAERDYSSGNEEAARAQKEADHWASTATPLDAVEASRFTSSLLSLGTAQTLLTRNSPEPAHDVSSSSESVLQPRSKNLSQGS
jgi:hypothetical protein